jgi:hypothetical protein
VIQGATTEPERRERSCFSEVGFEVRRSNIVLGNIQCVMLTPSRRSKTRPKTNLALAHLTKPTHHERDLDLAEIKTGQLR